MNNNTSALTLPSPAISSEDDFHIQRYLRQVASVQRPPQQGFEVRGLYKCHISQTLSPDRKFDDFWVKYYMGGSLITFESSLATQENGFQEPENTSPTEKKESSTENKESIATIQGKKQKIGRFTAKSKRKLQQRFAQLDRSRLKYLPKMLTLTYPKKYSSDPAVWKENLDDFLEHHFKPHFPNTFIIWKLEPQRRGAPHYHLLIFSDDSKLLNRVYTQKEKLARSWYQVVASGDEKHLRAGIRVGFAPKTKNGRPIKKRAQDFANWDMVSGYVAKYLGKVTGLFKSESNGDEEIKQVGRYWGIYNRSLYNQFVTEKSIQLSEAEYMKLKKMVIDQTTKDMDTKAESILFKMTSEQRKEAKRCLVDLRQQLARIATIPERHGNIEVEIDLEDDFHIKRYLQQFVMAFRYRWRKMDKYGIFAFLPSEVIERLMAGEEVADRAAKVAT